MRARPERAMTFRVPEGSEDGDEANVETLWCLHSPPLSPVLRHQDREAQQLLLDCAACPGIASRWDL